MIRERKLGALVVVVACCALLCAASTVINLATQVKGVLAVGNGGTGASSLSADCVLAGNGTSALATVCPSAAGQVLTDNGSGVATSFSPVQLFIDDAADLSTITPAAGPASVYLDYLPPSHGPATVTLSDGQVDGQLLTFVCDSNMTRAEPWNISGDFFEFTTLSLGGSSVGSDSSCGAVLMWSNANGVWELLSIYGGTDF